MIVTELNQFKELFSLLHCDVVEARNRLSKEKNEYNRRSYVRAFFAFVEGCMASMKAVSLASAESRIVHFSVAEVALLREEMYDLSDSGKPRITQRFLPTAKNFRFANSMFEKALHCSHHIVYSGLGWQQFQRALEIRHRITHPKKSVDPRISDQEAAIIRDAAVWWSDNIRKLIQSIDLTSRNAC